MMTTLFGIAMAMLYGANRQVAIESSYNGLSGIAAQRLTVGDNSER
jgi:hypothetical protein